MTTQILVTALSGGLAGAIAANWFTIWRDCRGRKRTFRGYIRSVLAEANALDLENLHPRELVRHHQATIQGIRTQCALVYDDICSSRRSKFGIALVTYCGLKHQDVEPPTPYDPTRPETTVTPNYGSGHGKLISLLTELIDCAK